MNFISNKHKALFLHLPKNGGGSISHILEKQPHFKPIPAKGKIQNGVFRNVINQLQLRKYNVNEILNEYFIFSVVRNPYDRLVSGWKYLKKNKSFSEIVHNLNKERNTNNDWVWHAVLPQSTHLLNFQYINKLCRFESYEEEIRNVLKRFDIVVDGKIPHIHKTNNYNFKQHYNSELYDIVYKFFKKDFKQLNYPILT